MSCSTTSVPLLYVIFWIAFCRRLRALPRNHAYLWLIGPFVYLVYSMVRGHRIGWYPYHFLNPLTRWLPAYYLRDSWVFGRLPPLRTRRGAPDSPDRAAGLETGTSILAMRAAEPSETLYNRGEIMADDQNPQLPLGPNSDNPNGSDSTLRARVRRCSSYQY